MYVLFFEECCWLFQSCVGRWRVWKHEGGRKRSQDPFVGGACGICAIPPNESDGWRWSSNPLPDLFIWCMSVWVLYVFFYGIFWVFSYDEYGHQVLCRIFLQFQLWVFWFSFVIIIFYRKVCCCLPPVLFSHFPWMWCSLLMYQTNNNFMNYLRQYYMFIFHIQHNFMLL